MKTILFLFLFYVFINPSLSQNNIAEVYLNGVLNGQFKSWHSNGELKVEGSYTKNQRSGVWNIWDSLGNKLMTRVYGENHEFSVTTFDGNDALKDEKYQQKSIKRNSDGYFPFVELSQNDVAYSKRLWRIIGRTEINEALFESNNLYNNFLNLIDKAKIKGYSSKSDQFEYLLEPNDVSKYKGKTVLSYKIKEDWFYDKSRNTGEVRIIGICPIIEVDGVEVEAFWVYYPEIRKYLAKLNLDDTFYFHQFNSAIIRETNVNGKFISEYVKPEGITKEVLRIESEIIEVEISFWLQLATHSE